MSSVLTGLALTGASQPMTIKFLDTAANLPVIGQTIDAS
jgi:hypothetical protein